MGATVAVAQPIDPYGDAPTDKPSATPVKPSVPVPVPVPVRPTRPAPIDPYAPAPAPTPAPTPAPVAVDPDVEIDEAVAVGLLVRARALDGEGAVAEAKQLVVEAMARRTSGPTYDEGTLLLAALNRKLGIVDAPTSALDPIAPPPDVVPALDEVDEPPPPRRHDGSGARALTGYGILAGAALGAAVSGVDDAGPTLGLALAGAAAGGLVGRWAARRGDLDPADAHVIGSGIVWGGLAGGFLADVVSGLHDSDAGDIAVGAGLGAAGGALLAAGWRRPELTVGDAALIDSTALWGTAAGLGFGLAIAPAEGEAYSLNATLGALGGYLVGHVAARNREVSAGRLAKVNAIAALGALAPFLFYAAIADDSVDDDEQAAGWLSLAGLGAGIYFGFRWTHEPALDGGVDDAPAAMVRRSSAGGWSVGGPVLAPIHTPAAGTTGAAVTLLGGAW